MNFQKRILAEANKCFKNKDRYNFQQISEHEFTIEFTIVNQESIYYNQTHTILLKTRYGNGDDIYQYPINKPLVKFLSNIWHPNIGYDNGIVCIDILNEPEKWSALQSFDSIFSSILILLDNPNTESPQDVEACKDFVNNINQKQELINIVNSKYKKYN